MRLGLLFVLVWVRGKEARTLISFTPQNGAQLQLLRALHLNGADVVRKARALGQQAAILAHSGEAREITRRLRRASIAFSQKAVSASPQPQRTRRAIHASAPEKSSSAYFSEFALDEYHTFEEMEKFIAAAVQVNSAFMKKSTLAITYMNNSIPYLTIGYQNRTVKPALFIDANIHAREWISSAVALYLIKEFSKPTYTSLLNTIDIVIAPMMNPDGYEYTRLQDRFWRKNRSPQQVCAGVDLNRNFPYKWGYIGASSEPCQEIFKGPKPASELEAIGLINHLNFNRHRYKAYITLHSFGQDWLYPFGYKGKTYPDDVNELVNLANAAADAVRKVNNTVYTVANSADLLYPAAGASDDYAKSIGIKYSYTIELPPLDSSELEFKLPPTEIVKVASELVPGLVVVANEVAAYAKT